MKPLIRTFLRLFESYLVIMSLSVGAGLLLPQYFTPLAGFSSFLLQGIFFLTGIKVDVQQLVVNGKRPLRLLLATLVMLIVFPIIAYPLAKFFVPEAAVGIFLLAAMPTAMSAPLFASLAGGSVELALLLTIFSSALAPFTIPLVTSMVMGSGVNLSTSTMLKDLLLIVFPPLFAGQLVRALFHANLKIASFALKPLSILLLGLITTGIIAKNSAAIIASINYSLLPLFAVILIFSLLTHAVGYSIGIGRPHSEKVSYAIALAYLNIVLAIYLAGRFFPDPKTLLTTVIALLLWTVLFAPFRAWALWWAKSHA